MNISLKDGKILDIKDNKTVLEIAQIISESLARVAVCASVDNELVGLDYVVSKDCNLNILTNKDEQSISVFRHTAAHVLAQAIKRLYKGAKLGVGPSTSTGFYYDIEFDEAINQDDLEKIEHQMQAVIDSNYAITCKTVSKSVAIKRFENIQESYKVELVKGFNKEEPITIYTQGEFFDLCKGPHLSHTGKVKYFKLTQITGAYWKGIQDNKMLTRIYGVAFEKKSELDAYLEGIEEAKKRDHVKLGRELGIFITDESIGQGLPLFAPKGARIMQTLIRWVEDEEAKRGFLITRTPLIAKSDLYKMSGHWDHYREGMFVFGENESDFMALRPMTCPFQFSIYNNGNKSYRDLPIRYAETSTLFRNESSGEMHGLIRVRQFTLSDGHIVCMPSQLEEEFDKCLELTYYLLNTIGLDKDVTFRFSKHDSNAKEKFINDPKMWEQTESILKSILDKQKISYVESVGDAAFYGPKLDIQIKNVWGKEDTIITIQVDSALALRFNMEYVTEDGSKKNPMIIHRSSIGCYERTLAILIEKYKGALPLWLSPVQVKVMSLTDRTISKVNEITGDLISKGILAESDNRQEKIGYKIREAQLSKIPYMLIIGDKEAAIDNVSVRTRKGGDMGAMPYTDFLKMISDQIVAKSNDI